MPKNTMNSELSTSDKHRDAGEGHRKIVVEQAQKQLQTFFDELKNGTSNYRTVASLSGQVAQEYRGRCVLELLQNAHDALARAEPGDPKKVSFVFRTSPEPILLIGNSGRPFHQEDFEGICQLGQSPKDPNESVGNKGLGFRSVLEVCTCPEIWSSSEVNKNISYFFRFDPSVSDVVAASAADLQERGLITRSPFDDQQLLVDWSQEQLEQYRQRLSVSRLDGEAEARNYLSPYLLPLPLEQSVSEVEDLFADGHVTVIRLRLDGGRAGSGDDAVRSIKEQLDALDARSMVFLSHLSMLTIDVDGKRRTLERLIDSEVELPDGLRTRQQRLLVGLDEAERGENDTRQFHVWVRDFGGDEDPEQAERVRAAVEHLPNRWPEVRRVTIGIAMEEAGDPNDGAFVIFLPTEVTTGTAALVNAPFYGTLNRRHIDFGDGYNDLLIELIADLCLDVAVDLTKGPTDSWRAMAVINLLSSTGTVSGETWRFF